jgi:hypothetical protein
MDNCKRQLNPTYSVLCDYLCQSRLQVGHLAVIEESQASW